MELTKGESIDVCMRGGSSCSSDEVLVMRMEQRGCVSSMGFKNQPHSGRNLKSQSMSSIVKY